MADTQDEQSKYKIHIDMWKHYDDLRQAKNSGFLTTNSILVAITGSLFKDGKPVELIVLSVLGIIVCISWFLLLTRNSAYIKFHRKEAGNGDEEYWKPASKTPDSKYTDRAPLLAFFILWLIVLTLSIIKLIH